MKVIQQDLATVPLAELVSRATPERAARVVAPAANRAFREHFFRLNQERPNRLGGKRTNFFGQAAKSTGATADGGNVVVNIAHVGIRQRVEGGIIRPTGGRKFLTIPAIAEAYGTRAREHPFLHAVFSPGGRVSGALVETEHTAVSFTQGRGRQKGTTVTKRGEDRGGKVWFWLVNSVKQPPDPTVLPSADTVRAAAVTALDTWFNLKAARAAAPAI